MIAVAIHIPRPAETMSISLNHGPWSTVTLAHTELIRRFSHSGKVIFTIDKVTVFSVNVTNAKVVNVNNDTSNNPDVRIDVKDLVFSEKSLKVLVLCENDALSKKEMLLLLGVTYQTHNVRNIINPLIDSGCLKPIDDDKSKSRNIHYKTTVRGQEYLKSQASMLPTDHSSMNNLDNDSEPLLFPEFD